MSRPMAGVEIDAPVLAFVPLGAGMDKGSEDGAGA